MGRDISLFIDFHQGENRITNYCGLILKMIYQESPVAFQETIVNLLGDLNTGFDILPVFHQQEKKSSSKTAKSIPDLILRQSSFNIYFEVKTTDWFYEDQVNRHLNNLVEEFKNADNKILFLLTSEFNNDIRDRLKESISAAEEKNTIIQIVTFEEFISAVKEASDKYIEKGRYINSVIPEFEEFLDRSGLLPSWKHTIDVTPCGATINGECIFALQQAVLITTLDQSSLALTGAKAFASFLKYPELLSHKKQKTDAFLSLCNGAILMILMRRRILN